MHVDRENRHVLAVLTAMVRNLHEALALQQEKLNGASVACSRTKKEMEDFQKEVDHLERKTGLRRRWLDLRPAKS